MAKLRIGIFKQAVAFPFRNFGALLRLGLMPGLLALAVTYLVLSAVDLQLPPHPTPENIRPFVKTMLWLGIVLRIIFGIVLIIYAVGIHRLIIRGEYPDWVVFRFGPFELAYATAVIFFFALYEVERYVFLLPAWGLGLIPAALLNPNPLSFEPPTMANPHPNVLIPVFVIFVILSVAAAIWLNVRLALIFAHAAVTGKLSLSVPWNAMRGNFWRFVLSVVVVAIVGAVLYFVAMILLGPVVGIFPHGFRVSGSSAAGPEPISVAHAIFMAIAFGLPFGGIFFAMVIALLSYTYKALVEGHDGSAVPAV